MVYHSPVLLSEVLTILDPQDGQQFIDATLGNGGHTIEILKRQATVYGLDQDHKNIKIATDRIKSLHLSANFHPIHTNFSQISSLNIKADGILFDLGLSQNQLQARGRGFSFNDSDSLDMRLDPKAQNITAADIINTYSANQIFEIFSKYSQEKNSRLYTDLIIKNRPFNSAKQLADLINTTTSRTKIHPATKIFMALRIAVNQEFENLHTALSRSLDLLKPHGRVCVISFHSGEDRIVKQFIRSHHLLNLTPKPIIPSFTEIKINPLSRSAHLRAFSI